MKRIILWTLTLCLTLALMMNTALAVDATILKEEEENWRSMRAVVTIGDTAYFSIYTDGGAELWHWKEGMADAEPLAKGLANAENYDSLETMEQHYQYLLEDGALSALPDMAHAIGEIFTDGEKLYSVNHLSGLVFSIDVADGKINYTDVVTLKDTTPMYQVEEEYRWYQYPTAVVMAGGKLLWSKSGWDNASRETVYEVYAFDLTDGSVKKASAEHVHTMTAYKDGQVLLFSRDPETEYDQATGEYRPYIMQAYDPAADKITATLGEFSGTNWLNSGEVVCDVNSNTIFYVEGSRIMGLKDMKTAVQYGFLMNGSGELELLGDSIIAMNYTATSIRTLKEGFTTEHSVNFFGGYVDTQAFAEQYPDVPVYTQGYDSQSTAEEFDRLMSAGDEAPDVLRLYVESAPFETLRDKGYCLDLSTSEKISAYVNDLYPAFKDVVTKDGAIYAVPVTAYSYDGWFINKKVMEDMGLSAEELPTNLVELCEFATRWNDEFCEDFPNYSLLEYTSDYKQKLFDIMLEGWIGYCQHNDMELRFDDPIFREMMAALEKMEVKDLDASTKSTDPEVSDYKQGLIWNDANLIGNWNGYMEETSDRIFIPMTLTAGTDYFCQVENMNLYIVNPRSDDAEYAIKLIEMQLDEVYDNNRHTLLMSETEPVEYKYYEELVQNAQEWLDELEKMLAEADEADKKDLEDSIAAQKQYMEKEMPRNRYEIHPAAIEHYVNVLAPAMSVRLPSVIDQNDEGSGELRTLIDRYLDGQIKLDQFIREADGKLRMMQMEDY